MYLLFLASGCGIGCLLAVQASANQRLGTAVASPFGAASLQLAVAATALLGALVVTGEAAVLPSALDVSPPWLLLAGVASPFYILAGILLFPRLGALTSVGLLVTGQVVSSLALDIGGWLWVPPQDVGWFPLLGAAGVVVGIAIVGRAQRPGGGSPGALPHGRHPQPSPARRAEDGTAIPWIALGLAAGAVLPGQGALNAQVHAQLDVALAVGAVSFLVATATIVTLLVMLLASGRAAPPRPAGLSTMPWWGWLGGWCASVYVTGTFLLIPRIGAATTIALTVTGQQLASAAIDHLGLLGMPRRQLSPARISGLGLLLLGSAASQLT